VKPTLQGSRNTVVLAAFVATLCLTGSAAQAASGPAAAPTSPEAGLAIINAERQANGIPPVVLNAQWSQGCAEYVRYLDLNPAAYDNDPHHEALGNPGYTALGAIAGLFGNLVGTDDWGGTDPWASAPLHLIGNLDPLVKQIGIAAASGYSCLTIQAESPSSETNVVYSYPGPGRTDVPTSENTSSESPNPTALLGLSPVATGPYLFLYGDGPWTANSHQAFTVQEASLTAADGTPVPIKIADWGSPISHHLGVANAMLVPISPLRAGTTYTALATVTSMGVTLSHTWSFTTVAHPPVPVRPEAPTGGKLSRLSVSAHTPRRGQVAGVSIGYALSGGSSEVSFTLTQKRLGYRARGTCLDPSWRSFYPAAPRCWMFGPLTKLSLTRAAAVTNGEHTLPLRRLVPRGLAVGSYRLSAHADHGLVSVTFVVRP
jgi:hypothetical protein